MRESKRERKKESKTSFDDPRSSINRNSLGQELKFIASTRATHMYQKEEISPKIQMRRFGGNQCFRVYEVLSRPPTILLRSKR